MGIRKRAWSALAAVGIGLLGLALPAGAFAATAKPHRAESMPVEGSAKNRINAWTIGLAGGQLEGAPIRLAAEIARAVDDGDQLHVLPIVTRGPSDNIESLLYLRGVDAAIVNADLLAQFEDKIPNLRKRMAYVLNLFPSEVHILVRPGINSLADLKGKKVNFNTEGTAAAYTGPLLFKRLGIDVDETFIPHQIAFEKMKTGEISAVFFVTSKPIDAFLKRHFEQGYKFLSVPYDDKVADLYLPASLDHADYPALIPEGSQVQTIAVPTALIVFNWPPGTERYRRVARFVQRLFDNMSRLQVAGYDPKWKAINLAAEVPGLVRFAPAQQWLDKMSHIESVATSNKSNEVDVNLARQQIARDTNLDPKEQELLLKSFLQWVKTRH